MKRGRYDGRYRMEFLQPLDETDYVFIEVTTKTGSGPFLKKSSNLSLFRPLTYGDNKLFYSPNYTLTNKADLEPDLRSTVFWAPNILTNEKGEAKTSFFSADQKGSYTVWIEGTDIQGNFGMKTMKLIIK